ncbi:MAG: LysR substrate-binding domain-containing protein [Gammaproteobacteria bacterium]
MTQLNSELRGTLRVTAPPSFGTFHLTPAIADYETIYTDVYVYLALNDELVDLPGGGFDVGLKIGPLPDSRIIARKLAYTRLVVCGVPTYFEQHGIPRGIEDLARHNCLRDTPAHHLSDPRSPSIASQRLDPKRPLPSGSVREPIPPFGPALAHTPKTPRNPALRAGE